MIIDSSAIISIVFQEPGFEDFLEQLLSTSFTGIGTPTLVETGLVMSARIGKNTSSILDRLIRELEITEVPFGPDHWREAINAYNRFGKGRHPAGLNFGDCLTYSVAKLADLPLLCKGNDFSKTDLELVI